MPPKVDVNHPENARLLKLFESLNLSGNRAVETLTNPKHVAALESVIADNNLTSKSLDPKASALIISASTAKEASNKPKRDYVVSRIVDGSLASSDQVNAAYKFLATTDGEPDKASFDKECGVGVVVTPEQCRSAVDDYIASHRSDLDPVEGWPKLGSILAGVKATPEMRWASAVDVKSAVDASLLATYGPKKAPPPKEKKKPAAASTSADAKKDAAPAGPVDPDAMFKEGFLANLHKPGENPQIKPELREQHLAATKGMVMTRFPPEPNGFLHIGHSKAIAVNFGYARFNNGLCYLRYDDTNPEAEEEQYFTSILETVRWLGFEPFKVTYSSDYFQQLYELAVELIKRGKAYVDHSTPDEIKEQRGGPERGPRKPSRYRDRPIHESLDDFEAMKNGKYPPGKVTLRMKQNLENGNPQMWDLIAYRVLEASHHRTGKDWCIYPTYDFTHCLVDSFENISHSLCTTEFILSRESYEWLCDALEVYKPRQSEYGRLALQGTVMSKRKILKLVKERYIEDWDDPRMFTLIALRRRGVPPGAILSFVSSLGVTTAKSTIMISRFDQAVRQYLEFSTPRLMMVLNPLKVTIENLPADHFQELEKPLHPKAPEMGTNKMPFTCTVYIDASDFRAVDSKDYFRLAPGKTVGLLQVPYPITCTSFKTNDQGEPIEVIATYGDASTPKPKTYIQWVAEHAPSKSPVRVDETRIFHQLFTSDDPAAEENFLDHVNPDSLEIVEGAMVEVGFWDVARQSMEQARRDAADRTKKAEVDAAKAQSETQTAATEGAGAGAPERTADQLVGKELVRFQGMRTAYFALDRLSGDLGLFGDKKQGGKIVLNRIVSLKEDAKKDDKKTNAPVKKGK
ncbi:Glutamyl/glutaminyl-tRNA synthetase, class Ib, anti-codon binding domain protein [Kalmanozyma brasiliensis GHG001]|uniref:glutamine--tRNA ligase n=1 Tax=Kalmanozyma brasiliensis (strain GHG001) TaxID=1365824 RepID=V5EY21_KALBG|nr:Glutamyl/glutaminyl-tRNA synthetase, class Ib, anti-codon binding domain protein [Kalmanozyma brasiliensis GHG001]EST08533.1 Glutamyl/glutaminyl-tRNA synthetase, class Ib, anti-codon binding domain protein [Kalmanozyma brasiliensis GHG001]